MFLKVGSDYLNIDHVQSVEYLDDDECEVTFTSGDSIVIKMAAADLVKQIERRQEVG